MIDEMLLRRRVELYARVLADLEEGERDGWLPTDVVTNKLWVQQELATMRLELQRQGTGARRSELALSCC